RRREVDRIKAVRFGQLRGCEPRKQATIIKLVDYRPEATTALCRHRKPTQGCASSLQKKPEGPLALRQASESGVAQFYNTARRCRKIRYFCNRFLVGNAACGHAFPSLIVIPTNLPTQRRRPRID